MYLNNLNTLLAQLLLFFNSVINHLLQCINRKRIGERKWKQKKK